ncbi:hypothetical protein P9857_11265 [Anoxybacillus geothermalis]|uniref:hypothetical protein n=1 Tax=Geobacillus TaxID=129337 RepID=UPI0005082321|nr:MULTISPECIES: hypothetical protein [Geobacillus]AKU27726.1 hypothetical protein IB49_16470 [Geobacillus sp. LC300]MED5074536.1 hypothetical protein [Anoxybacillus geothermalis]STO11761.1 Uncharacterised protein [[Flavobacterium] thermophilum]KFL17419.1 hypothetical protein ET31_00640 [Geobacillus stearothermophilus]KFX35956.1 hypothetical protein GT94_03995 [Geobacillus stearothermophilus]
MMAFWLTISLLLHALSFWLIIVLFLRLSRLGEAERRAEELEEAMTAYLAAWKEENKRFLAELDSLLGSGAAPFVSAPETNDAPSVQRGANGKETASMLGAGGGEIGGGFEKRTAEAKKEENEPAERGETEKRTETSRPSAAPGYFPDIGTVKDVLELSLTRPADASELARRLYAEGATVEEIAKQLGKGKTEVELWLKFAQKTNQ